MITLGSMIVKLFNMFPPAIWLAMIGLNLVICGVGYSVGSSDMMLLSIGSGGCCYISYYLAMKNKEK